MRILFVCTGNICRSPTAEAILRRQVEQKGLSGVLVDSAGTHGYHQGEPPDPRAVQAAARRGYDLSGLRARKVVERDYESFDLLLAMDQGHLRILEHHCPPNHRVKLQRFLERDVPDPYYGDGQGFETVLDMIEAGCARLLAEQGST